ncbi:DEAD/DEAH box helicase family protein [Halomontanus rarus]|uniref:DEAD/DEAH box helicase family protein n=1 Tax=Halomontanus rarus TaxID=3034020 RepID=UPI003CE4CD8B
MQAMGTLNDAFVTVVAHLHDIGKLTTWFQRHIRDEHVRPKERTHHAHVGGAIADYVLRVHPDPDIGAADRLAGTLAILKHHSALPDMAGSGTAFAQQFGDPTGGNEQTYKRIDEKLDDIQADNDARAIIEELINGMTNGAGSWNECREAIKNRGGLPTLAKKAGAIVARESKKNKDFYAYLVDAWTTLALADTTSAAHISLDDLDCGSLDSEAISHHIEGFDPATSELEQDLNVIRDAARTTALGRVEAFLESESNAATITLPTGFGKTLTSGQVGLTLAERKAARTGRPSRVVYALPFTSIIDQTANELNDVFPDSGPLDLAVHHHLADVSPDEVAYETDDLADRDRTLIRDAWRQQFTLTTFVQLFESLAGPQKSQGLKLPALHNAVVILDEPQALPPGWMNLINRLCRVLTDRYDTHVISLTATQPKLFEMFEYTSDPFELVGADDVAFTTTPSPMDFIETHPRVRYILHPSVDSTDDTEALTHGNAADILVENLDAPTLAICNTVASSHTLAERAQERVGGTTLNDRFEEWVTDRDSTDPDLDVFADSLDIDEPLVAHLTSRHRPFDRLSLIGVAKRLCERDASLLFVSTQLVEAGVDISFDNLYRDFAPIPSLVQAAGRCNRSFETERRTVCIWKLASDDGRSPSDIIYSALAFGDPLVATAQALDDHRSGMCIDEVTMIGDAVDMYFDAYHDESGTAETSLPSLVDSASCDTLGECHLIDQTESLDIIVPRTPAEAKTVLRLTKEGGADALITAQEMRQSTVSIPAYDSNASEITRFKAQLLSISDETNLYALPDASTYDAFHGLSNSDSLI